MVAGVAGAVVTLGGLFVPGVRAIERRAPREAAVEAAEPVAVNA